MFRFLIKDESHDSSIMDLMLIYLLAGSAQNICMILDNDQSIYSFRGTNIKAVVNMVNVFKNTKIHVLNTNYRSTQTIVEASKEVIDKNEKIIDKNLRSNNEKGNKIQFFFEKNDACEASRVVSLINYCVEKGFKYNDIAVLYRMRYESRNIENALLKYSIPYHLYSGIDFYSRAEIKDIMSYFKLLINPTDYVAFKRAVGVPKRGVGNKTIEKIINYSQDKQIGVIEACRTLFFNGTAKKGMDQFLNIMDYISNIVYEENQPPKEAIQNFLEMISYRNYLYDSCKDEDECMTKIENVDNLLELSENYDDIPTMIDEISLIKPADEQDDNSVQLLTMHMSKGLEWNIVIIVDAVEGSNPSYMAQTSEDFEEERRIFYVAMTRAKKLLFILSPNISYRNGRPSKNKISRYINDIDISNIKRYDFRSK